MIIELLVSALVGLFTFVGNLMPSWSPPAFVDSIAGTISTVATNMAPLGTWVPFGAAANATLAVVAVVGVALAIRLVRIVLSLLSGGGGS